MWSNNETMYLTLSQEYDMVHKPIVASFCRFMLWQPSSSSVTAFTAAMCISHVFICCHETASEHQFLFQTCGKQLQEYTKCLKLLMEIKLYLTKMIKVVGSCRTLKIQELLAKDQRIIVKLTVNQLHIKTQSSRFFMNIWKRGKPTPVCSTKPHLSRNSTESQLCKLHHGKVEISHQPQLLDLVPANLLLP